MSYTFQAMTDEELNQLLPEGVYDFEVTKSTRKTSKAGNAMAEINLSVWDSAGKTYFVRDFLIFSSIPLNIRKVKHFCDSVGLQEEYKKGELPEELEFMSGKVKVGVEDEQPKQKWNAEKNCMVDDGFYPKKNVVMDYIKADKTARNDAKSANVVDSDFNDDVPF